MQRPKWLRGRTSDQQFTAINSGTRLSNSNQNPWIISCTKQENGRCICTVSAGTVVHQSPELKYKKGVIQNWLINTAHIDVRNIPKLLEDIGLK